MSQETLIGNLGGGISEEDTKLVDSILNDINNSNGPPKQQQQQQQQQQVQQSSQPQQQQQLSPEQIKMIQHQEMMRQQALSQQQALAQQQSVQQQAISQQMNMIKGSNNDIIDNIKLEAKNIMTVMFLCILFNIEQVDNILKGFNLFIGENGNLNIQAIFLKSIIIGIIFYIVKTYLL